MITPAFLVVCYFIFAYGISIVVTQGVGPFNILVKWRAFADWVGPNFGMLFSCMMCFPTNVGIVMSLLNWFLIPACFTPFNLVFADFHNVWWMSIVAALMDGFATAAVCYTVHNINDYIDKSTPIFEDE